MGSPSGLAKSLRSVTERKPAAATVVAVFLQNSLLETLCIFASLEIARSKYWKTMADAARATMNAAGHFCSKNSLPMHVGVIDAVVSYSLRCAYAGESQTHS